MGALSCVIIDEIWVWMDGWCVHICVVHAIVSKCNGPPCALRGWYYERERERELESASCGLSTKKGHSVGAISLAEKTLACEREARQHFAIDEGELDWAWNCFVLNFLFISLCHWIGCALFFAYCLLWGGHTHGHGFYRMAMTAPCKRGLPHTPWLRCASLCSK